MKQLIKFGAPLLFMVFALMLAGCGSRDQNTPSTGSSSQGTPPEIINAAKKQSQDMGNHPPPNATTAPATH